MSKRPNSPPRPEERPTEDEVRARARPRARSYGLGLLLRQNDDGVAVSAAENENGNGNGDGVDRYGRGLPLLYELNYGLRGQSKIPEAKRAYPLCLCYNGVEPITNTSQHTNGEMYMAPEEGGLLGSGSGSGSGWNSPPPRWLPTLPPPPPPPQPHPSSSSPSVDTLPFLQQPLHTRHLAPPYTEIPSALVTSARNDRETMDHSSPRPNSAHTQENRQLSHLGSPAPSSSLDSTLPPLTPTSQHLAHPLGMGGNGFGVQAGGPPSPTGSTFTFTSSMQNAIFREDEGRLYNATQDDYALPADMEEVQRLDIQHHAIRVLVGGNHLPHVGEHLKRNSPLGRDMRILDLGCGTGTWCVEIAREFPEAEVIGIDLVPIQPDNLPDNCSFTIDDITKGLPYPDGTFDLVTGRLLVMGLRDYPSLLTDVARVIKPGGMYVATEPDINLILHDGGPERDMKGWKAWERGLQTAMKTRGTDPHLAPKLHRYFNESGVFEHVEGLRVDWPMTPWSTDPKQRNVGLVMLRDVRQFPDTSRLLIIDAAGIPPHEYDRIKIRFLQEVEMNYKVTWNLWTCWGFKRA
ncbi:uncharacterized protein I303_106851 [Kwoniella dejecticola CBS 10117]|uniref:Methyltransferase domain-containing protein n=1 Tax=Kwoniella dejecticola CBS 10117 TaxID=1296121 RepID=A0A1A5ZTM7_9TREE|nr:uncharacterized protein I303_08508 [Kwoniella dejecticola CBS 10117]OBR81125.1 hypothetical protein I303_08508 [Kwoniella dejecticola CBS 10117]